MPTLIKMGCEAHCASELDHLVDHQTKDAQRLTRQNNGLEGNGGDDEDRTHDLRIANSKLFIIYNCFIWVFEIVVY